MRLLVVLGALLAVAACEQLSCLCGRQAGGSALQLSCLKFEGQNVTCTEDGTNVGNAVDSQPPPKSHISKRWASCPPAKADPLRGYTYARGVGLVKLFRVSARYRDAKDRCQKDGGRLVNVIGRNTTKQLATLFPGDRELPSAYTGVTYSRDKRRYYGSDGKPAAALPWAPDEPSNRTGDECVAVGGRGRLTSCRCDQPAPFICERPYKAPQGYSWVPAAGRFLMLSNDRRTYSDALSACKGDGATLAVPDTWERAEAMLDYSAPRARKFYVGFTYKFVGSDYVTPSGKLMSSMEFSNWKSDDHQNDLRHKFDGCVALYSAGYYGDVDCRKKYNYLCELQVQP